MMKKVIFFAYLLAFSAMGFSQSFSKCHFDEYLNASLQSAEFAKKHAEFEKKLSTSSFQKSETVFIIPVVFHVIYKNSTENISDNQIYSQLAILNEDYRKLNADTSLVVLGFSTADVRIEFCLAQRDPQGNVSTGINRISTNIDNIGTSEQYYVIQPAWDRTSYLNIWVGDYGTDNLGNNILGKASPPSEPNANKDGVIINHIAFGTSGSAQSPYNQGRTTVHEIGHWLGLYHPWGINSVSCAEDDLVADTPNQGRIYFGCPTNPRSTCGSDDMLSNFMGYVDDRCMGNFTEGQKTRMRNSFVSVRSNILLSKACLAVGLDENAQQLDLSVFPNPANESVTLEFGQSFSNSLRIQLYDIRGREVLKLRPDQLSDKKIQLNTSGLESGLYLLKVQDGKDFFRSKLTVQH